MVWARADRPARTLIEAATTDGFRDIVYASFADALPETHFTAEALIEDLPAGQDIFYRLRLQDLSSPAAVGQPVIGRFRTAPSDRRSISFVWSGDTAGRLGHRRFARRHAHLRDNAAQPARFFRSLR